MPRIPINPAAGKCQVTLQAASLETGKLPRAVAAVQTDLTDQETCSLSAYPDNTDSPDRAWKPGIWTNGCQQSAIDNQHSKQYRTCLQEACKGTQACLCQEQECSLSCGER
ncbi:MAG: hypothetical protein FRX49_10247 [Trebouxia sp. A1-2]|nr:MAG: hypothetical protein FRX49_10247 [Trebouxia sp. A1-2]